MDQQVKTGIDLDLVEAGYINKVLIVSHDPDLIEKVKDLLMQNGYAVLSALSIKDGVGKIYSFLPEAIIIDSSLAKSAESTEIRSVLGPIKEVAKVPVLVIVDGDKNAVVEWLNGGADEVIERPIHEGEFLARLAARMRQFNITGSNVWVKFDDIGLRLNLRTREVFYRGARIRMSSKMFGLLSLLAINAPEPVPYEVLSRNLWNKPASPESIQRLKYIVHLVRQKLASIDPEGKYLIENISALGYVMKARRS